MRYIAPSESIECVINYHDVLDWITSRSILYKSRVHMDGHSWELYIYIYIDEGSQTAKDGLLSKVIDCQSKALVDNDY
jgi:hypothetical protein